MQDSFNGEHLTEFPDYYRVRMEYPDTSIEFETALSKEMDDVLPGSGIGQGDRVGVCVGSRGISNLSEMVTLVCKKLADLGAIPRIIPAMGSHGGATADGQIEVLRSLGVDKDTCGADIVSSMDVSDIGTVLDGVPVYLADDCLAMDHTILINRLKPHTKFKGPVESGLYKMLCIGMGKHKGAAVCHQAALRHGFSPVIKAMGDMIIKKGNVRLGIGVVEGRHDETMAVRAFRSHDLYSGETEMLKIAKDNFPKLPFKELDSLIIHYVGKEISGSGMDPNVTGRAYDLMEDDFSGNLKATRIVILNLTDKTAGNGIGIGNADIITEAVYEKLDYNKMLVNALTSISLRKAFIPVRMPNDLMAVSTAFSTAGLKECREARSVIIRDTRHVSDFLASSALLGELESMPEANIGEKVELMFSESGELMPTL